MPPVHRELAMAAPTEAFIVLPHAFESRRAPLPPPSKASTQTGSDNVPRTDPSAHTSGCVANFNTISVHRLSVYHAGFNQFQSAHTPVGCVANFNLHFSSHSR